MRPFRYERATDAAAAARSVAANPQAKFLAGGTNLLDLMKEDIERPTQLVDLTRLGLAEIVRYGRRGVHRGPRDEQRHRQSPAHPAAVPPADTGHPCRRLGPAAQHGDQWRQPAAADAVPVFLRHGHAVQQTAAWKWVRALQGLNRIHAIFGWSDACVATYPGDMANALYALDAVVRVRRPDGRERRLPIGEFHRLPGNTPERDHNLEHGELIEAVELPQSTFAGHSYYLKVRDRASSAFALVAVAAALDLEGGRVRQARIVLGSVAHMPWRSRAAETALSGKPLSQESCQQAADVVVRDAKPLAHNTYKVELAKRAVVRALMRAGKLA